MDYHCALNSDSLRLKSEAAVFLRTEGANGLVHLPALLKCCKEIRQDKASLQRDEKRFLGSATLALGDLVGQAGFDESNLLHLEIRDWLIDSVYSENLDLAAYAIWGLGLLRTDDGKTVDCLKSVIVGGLRPVEHEFVTLRSIAMRMLVRTNRDFAITFRDTEAWKELKNVYSIWQEQSFSDEIQAEFVWMIEAEL
jgi:hypothetical protein